MRGEVANFLFGVFGGIGEEECEMVVDGEKLSGEFY